MITSNYMCYEWVKQVDAAVTASAKLGFVTVLSGSSGSGKSRYCERLKEKWKDETGQIHCHRVYGERDAADELRILVEGYSSPASPKESRGKLFGNLVRSLAEEIKSAETTLLVIDDADKGAPKLVASLFQTMDTLRELKHPCGLLLTGRMDPLEWKTLAGGDANRIYRYAQIEPLAANEGFGLVAKWCRSEDAKSKYRAGAPDAIAAAHALHLHTKGNFRVLEQFAKTKQLDFPDEELSHDLIKRIVMKLTPPFRLE